MYQHSTIHEACIIAVKDEQSNERVKAVVALKPECRDTANGEDIVAWCRTHMAAY